MAKAFMGECTIALLVCCLGAVALGRQIPADGPADFRRVNPQYLGEACRGKDPSDNNPGYYKLLYVASEASCRERCRSDVACHGIEYRGSDDRCELWTRAEGIGASREYASGGIVCLRHAFRPVDGGADRACRGASPTDNSASHKTVLPGVESLAGCKQLCEETSAQLCKGIEYHSNGRCELWTRDGGIGATQEKPGYACLRYDPSGASSVTTAVTTTTRVGRLRTTTTADICQQHFEYCDAACSGGSDPKSASRCREACAWEGYDMGCF
jgi:hypothetical protein